MGTPHSPAWASAAFRTSSSQPRSNTTLAEVASTSSAPNGHPILRGSVAFGGAPDPGPPGALPRVRSDSVTRVTRVTSLVGRDREVEVLRDTIAAAAGGRGQVVLIEGEPGIGKTRLVHRGAELGRTAGFEVSLGTCDDLLAARPFAALITALGIRLDASDAVRAAIASLVDSHDASDAALLRGAPNPGLQYRVVEALGALVERQAARGPLLLALDDLQWADPSTLVALRSIGRRIDTLPVVVIGACRVGHGVAELHRVTDDLLRAGATRLFVGPLDPASVATLISEVIDGTPSDLLLERAQGASGNPLFVIEYVRSTEPARGGSNGASDAPNEFRLTVLRRLAALSAKTNEAVRLAAVLGSTFSPADLASRRVATAYRRPRAGTARSRGKCNARRARYASRVARRRQRQPGPGLGVHVLTDGHELDRAGAPDRRRWGGWGRIRTFRGGVR